MSDDFQTTITHEPLSTDQIVETMLRLDRQLEHCLEVANRYPDSEALHGAIERLQTTLTVLSEIKVDIDESVEMIDDLLDAIDSKVVAKTDE